VIEVTGRSAAWLSETRVRVDGELAEAEPAPTRRVRLAWIDGPPASVNPVLVVSSPARGSNRITHLARRLITTGGVDRPGWVGETTVPRGAFDLECVDADGRVRFAQSIAAGADTVRLDVAGIDGRVLSTR
jgi:hypothetical protein